MTAGVRNRNPHTGFFVSLVLLKNICPLALENLFFM
jgi:hypothetical protein